MENKYLVTFEFRYSKIDPENSEEKNCCEDVITIGVYNTFEEAMEKGNKALEILENRYPLNPHYNRKERFSLMGGCFRSPKDLISNLGYLVTPFTFYGKITTLKYKDFNSVLDNIETIK